MGLNLEINKELSRAIETRAELKSGMLVCYIKIDNHGKLV